MAATKKTSRHLSRTEVMAMIGGAVLAVSLFLTWYHADNNKVRINGVEGPRDFSGWDVHTIQRWLLLGAAAAPFILAYIIVRGHQLSWARGEMTAVSSIAAFGLIVYGGLIDKPGDVSGLVHLRFGWFLALVGTILMLVGSALRASEVERARKPPGVL